MKAKEKLLTIKCDSKQQKQARKLLNDIQEKTSENHIFIILRALRSIEKRGQIDY